MSVALPQLLAVPNVSEGADVAAIDAISDAFTGLRKLHLHRDPDHGRSVFSLHGVQGALAGGLVAGAGKAFELLNIDGHDGVHPHVGAVDVCPVVFLDQRDRGAAIAEALVVANEIASQYDVPVFLYGELAHGRERAELRRGGVLILRERMHAGELVADFGPGVPHPTAGATLVTARPPLVAFNLELRDASLETAKSIAARLREAGGGPAGVRAIGLWLESKSRAQVSFNVHDPIASPLASLVEEVAKTAAVSAAELVGLAPAAAFDGFPDEIEIVGFDPDTQVIERVLRRKGDTAVS